MYTVTYTISGREYISHLSTIDKAVHIALIARGQGAQNVEIQTDGNCREIDN